MTTITVLDTETASLQGGVCDLAIAKINENLEVEWSVESLIDPEVPISASASGIHHITDEMVWDQPTLSEFMEMHNHPLGSDDLVVIGHNVQFDCRMLGVHLPETYRKLCTLKLARNMWPELENHKLQTLRYQFKLDAGTAHRAMGDVMTCISLLRYVAELKGTDLAGVMELARKPLSPDTKFPFGKHKGTPLKNVPKSYVRWVLEKTEIDPDLREALASLID